MESGLVQAGNVESGLVMWSLGWQCGVRAGNVECGLVMWSLG